MIPFPVSARSFVLPLALCAALLASCSKKQDAPPPEPVARMTYQLPSSAPAFSGERAFELLKKQVAFGSRVPNTPAHEACLRWMTETLRPLADTVRLQEFSMGGYDGVTLKLTNVIASFRPEAKERILFCAHWDSRPRAEREKDPAKQKLGIPGANDGASGVAVLLHMAEILAASKPAVGVDLVFFDGEDYGTEGDESMYCLGAKYFASSVNADYAPLFGILLDLVGDKDAVFPQEEYSLQYASDIVKIVWSTAGQLGIPNFKVQGYGGIIDDHGPLNTVAGIKVIDIIDAELVGQAAADPRRKYWHSLSDTPEQCSGETLGKVGKVLMHVLFGTKPV